MLNSETILFALNDVEDAYLESARARLGGEGRKRPAGRRILSLALAAVLVLALGVSAYAAYNAVGTPQAAERVAREQLAVWKDMGLIAPEIDLSRAADLVVEMPEHRGSHYWYGRFFRHSYAVRWYGGEGEGPKYGANLQVDTLSGKITMAFLNAGPDPGEAPTAAHQVELPVDPDHPDAGWETKTVYTCDNFDDLFPADMTVDRFCSLLAEYWGFSGYTLADTVDREMYHRRWDAVSGNTLLLDLPRLNPDNYYLTVFFEGDQLGAPMYVQLANFPSYVMLSVGTAHAIG